MTELYTGHPLAALTWTRLSMKLCNIRILPSAKAHPFSVIEAIIKGVSSQINMGGSPAVFHLTDRRHTAPMELYRELPLEIFFFNKNEFCLSQWRKVFIEYLADPASGRNFEIVAMGDFEERNLSTIAAEQGPINDNGEICLEFMTPFPFKRQGNRLRTDIDKDAFIHAFESRFQKLFGKDIIYQAQDDDFSVLPYYWNYTEIKHQSKSQPGNTQYIKGCFGHLYIKGLFKEFLPFMIIGAEIHTGAKPANSQGYYRLHKESLPYFSRNFPNKKAVLSIIDDVIDQYDHSLELFSTSGELPFTEDVYADRIVRQIAAGNFEPLPHTAFVIKKESGSEHLVERISIDDLITRQYILKTVSPVFERICNEESIGFRRGVSRDKAVDMIREVLKEGYQYVIESDIEDFFPAVDRSILNKLLEFSIPGKDVLLKEMIAKIIKAGYILNNEYRGRAKGLARGCPLSPILTNIYLNSFDEIIKKWNMRFIRYSDDFYIFTKNREEAETILSQTEVYLSESGLKIKKDKTCIRAIRERFQSLGVRFEGCEIETDYEDGMKTLKKPLYITEPYLFLSLNADAVEMHRNRNIIDTVPLRRISEIIVMEKTAFSSALLKKCTDYDIPLTMTLNSGYYIATIKPDSKRHFDISYLHTRNYNALTETEILCFAKEFAVNKLANYIPLFRECTAPELNRFIGELERSVENIHHADSVEQIRGFENAAEKKLYRQLNGLIADAAFHIKERERQNQDRINSLLNFGHYLLFSRINTTVRAEGLNPYLGFLHNRKDNRESLVCDIEELFWARIDKLIIHILNFEIITRNDFDETERGFRLSHEAMKKFLYQFEVEMEQKNNRNTLSLKEEIYTQITVIRKFFVENNILSFYRWEE